MSTHVLNSRNSRSLDLSWLRLLAEKRRFGYLALAATALAALLIGALLFGASRDARRDCTIGPYRYGDRNRDSEQADE